MYALTVNDHWAIRPDAGVYLTLGRSLADGHGMLYNGRAWWNIPPLVPLLVAGCRLVTGGDGLWLINAAMSAAAFGTALAAMGLANRLALHRPQNERMALAVGVLLVVGTSARLFEDSTCILTDVPFTLFVALALYFAARSREGHWAWAFAVGPALLAALATRLAAAPLAPAILLAVLMERRGAGYWRRVLAVAASLALFAAGLAAWMVVVRSWSDPDAADYFNAVSGGTVGVLRPDALLLALREVMRTPEALAGALVDQKLPWLNLAPTALALLGLVTCVRHGRWLAVWPPLAYLGMLVLWGNSAVAARYLLPMLPVMALLLLLGAESVATVVVLASRGRLPAARGRNLALAAAVATCLVISMPKDVRTIWRMRQTDFYAAYDDGDWQGAVAAAKALKARGNAETDVAATVEASVIHHLSGLRVHLAPLWKDKGAWSPEDIPPDAFASAVADARFRFLVIPADKPGWTAPALEAVAYTRAFYPPERFGRLLLLERKGPPGP
jgi:hypothetical protein